MKIIIEGEPKELSDFVVEIQNKAVFEEPDEISNMTEEEIDKFII